MRPSRPQSCISDSRAYRPAAAAQKRAAAPPGARASGRNPRPEPFGVLAHELERPHRRPSQRASIAAWNAASHVAGCTAACRASMKTIPSGVRPRLGATGVGAVCRTQVSARADDPRVAEVVAHQPLDALLRQRARVAEDVGRRFLQRMAEHVRVPLRLQVQNRADSQQEILGLVAAARGLPGRAAGASGSVRAAIQRIAVRSRSVPGASLTFGSS